ncbi:MAG: hypothetical protein IJ809_00700 [Clostridia bacterium]|nr:hypothetical protein [Clostridia bacterium]
MSSLPGHNFVYQKKGNTVNKIYNLKGEVIIDGIYSYSTDFYPFVTKDDTTYLFLKVGNIYELYNVTTNQKYPKTYANVSLDYMKEYYSYSEFIWETGYIFVNDSIPYCIDFNTMKESRMNVTVRIKAVLDYGYKYKITKK